MRLRYLAFLVLACVSATPPHPVATVLALTHVTVIDATGAAAKPDMTVIISDAKAYLDHGEKELAIKNYKKSIELNPANANGLEQLKKLGTN